MKIKIIIKNKFDNDISIDLHRSIDIYNFYGKYKGYYLDNLLYSLDFRVRQAIAEQGYRLDILINDPSFNVREMVAKQNYGLNILLKSREMIFSDI